MELFAVKRYDETKLKPEDEDAQEEIILQKLQSLKGKKELRKQRKQVSESIASNEEDEGVQQKVTEEEPAISAQNELSQEKSNVGEEFNTHEVNDEQPTLENDPANFLVLGDDHFKKVTKVDEVLPPWLSNPTIIDSDLSKKGKVDQKVEQPRPAAQSKSSKNGL